MVDTSRFTGGGQPTGRRTRRTRPGPIDTGARRERTQATRRVVSAGVEQSAEAAGLAGLGNALGSFFPVLEQKQDMEAQRQIDQNTEANRRAIQEIEAKVRANPEKAREARLTGDHSFFIPNDPARENQILQQAFKIVTAQTMAAEDFENEALPAILATPLDGDPDAAVEALIRKNTEGADGDFANNYGATLKKASAQAVTNWKNERTKLQIAESGRRLNQYYEGQLDVSTPTVETLDRLRTNGIGMLPVPAATAVQAADAALDAAIIRKSATDPQMLKLAHMPDPKRDGTSVATRNPGAIAKALQAAVDQDDSIRSFQAHQDLESIEQAIDETEAAGGSFVPLWVRINTHPQIHGSSSRSDALRKTIAAKIDQEGIQTGSVEMILAGRMPPMNDKDHNALASRLWDPAFVQEIADTKGMTVAAVTTRFNQYLAARGIGKDAKQIMEAQLLGATAAEDVGGTFLRLRALNESNSRGLNLAPRAKGLLKAMDMAFRQGGIDAAMLVRQRVLDFTNENGEATISGAYGRQLIEPDRTSGPNAGKTFGRAGTVDRAVGAWGLLEDALPIDQGLLGTTEADYDELPQPVRRVLQDAVDLAWVSLRGTNPDTDQIEALAAEIAKSQIGMEIGPDGEGQITVDRRPAVALGPDGTPVRSAGVTLNVIERANEWREANPEVSRLLGGFGGLRQDHMTTAGHGLAVTSIEGGFESPVILVPGRSFAIPMATAGAKVMDASTESIMGLTIMERDKDLGQIVLDTPLPPRTKAEARVEIDDNTFLAWDRSRGVWALRYRDVVPGVKPATPADLGAAQQRSLEREMEAYETPIMVDEALGLTPTQPKRSYFLDNAAPLGSPVDTQARGPYAPEQLLEVGNARRRALDELADKGVMTPSARTGVSGVTSLEDATSQGLKQSQDEGAWLDDLSRPANERATARLREIIEAHEGRVLHVYDDATGRRWKQRGKNRGNPTIGIGYNLRRENAKAELKRAGIDFDRVMDGGTITDGQAVALFEIAAQDVAGWVRKQFKGKQLREHQWIALTELAYNAPSTIGPRMKRFVGEGDWKAVAHEIRTNTTGGIPGHLKPAVRARRQKTARMFLGLPSD